MVSSVYQWGLEYIVIGNPFGLLLFKKEGNIMKGKKANKTIEEKPYERLGVTHFKRFVLGLEKGAIKRVYYLQQ